MRLLVLTNDQNDPSFRIRWGRYLDGLGGEARAFSDPWPEADTVVLHRRLLTAWDFGRLRRHAKRLVYDFDDALCFRPEPPHRSATRRRKFFRAIAHSDLVIAGNRYLGALARLRNRRVRVIPSAVDVERYEPAKKRDEFTAVWIGQRATLPHLRSILPALDGIRVRVIADEAPPGTEFVPWSLETETRALAECHVGLMPLPRGPYTRGKCGYKLLQYYAARLPAVASPVGVNRALADGGGALPATSPGEWAAAVRSLRDDPKRRQTLAVQGRFFVERRYAAGHTAERLSRVLGL